MAKPGGGASAVNPPINQPDLNTELFRKLKSVETYYNLAGFRGNYHTLSHLATYRRDIVRVDDLGLHLTWKESPVPVHFIMPLPAVYAQSDGAPTWTWQDLTPYSRALLFSYSKLIQSQLDFAFAKEHSLLDEPFLMDEGWMKWQTFLSTLFSSRAAGLTPPVHVSGNVFNDIDSRFKYGDLRLGRLNMIFWLTRYGDHYYRTRDPVLSFWHGYGKWVIIVFAYTTTMLTAMQVALAASVAPTWLTLTFKWVSYFVICLILLQIPFIFFFYSCLGLLRLHGWIKKR